VALVTFAAFTDIVAYSIAVPVLPDMSRRLGASPTVIGLMFAAFGVTLLAVSIPMGAVSDRVGRKVPLVGGLVALALSTLLLAFADRLSWLFIARLIQGAADAITWVVGFALLADLYGPAERGRVMGFVMSGASFGFMFGPSLGGWLYERGGVRLPFLTVGALAAICAVAFLWMRLPERPTSGERVDLRLIARDSAVATCTLAVIVIASTLSMLEPVLSLWLSATLDLTPARIGLVFGVAALAMTGFHPLCGRLADRWGGRRLTLAGLALSALMLPVLSRAWSFESAIGLYVLQAAAGALAITPSLAYMGEATSQAGGSSVNSEAFGVAYGLYNFAWGVGLLAGPAAGGFLFDRLGFGRLTLLWMPIMLVITLLLARVRK
jgi:MFS transporter, DHA1 family, solute carrier family 18 (vesicular amine transporter), member 1/2